MTLRRINESGQSLMIGVMLFIILLITIPSIIFLNQVSTRHGVMSQKRTKGREIAEEGIAFAIQKISQGWATNWPPLNGTGVFPTSLHFNGSRLFTSAQGGAYTITCTPGPVTGLLENYQAQIVARPMDTSVNAAGTLIPGGSMAAVVSQKTLAVKLPSGYSAPVALQMMNIAGNPAGGLFVHWGPLAIFDTSLWTVRWSMDLSRYPRKFSGGDITGYQPVLIPAHPTYPRSIPYITTPPTTPQNTDWKEYWANTSLGFANVINIAAYKTYAENTPSPVAASAIPTINHSTGGGVTADPGCTVNPCASIRLVDQTDTAIFSGAAFNPTTPPNPVIYVEGNVELRDVAFDLKHGAMIVTGNLNLGSSGYPNPGAGQTLNLRFPPTAPQEYPYNATGTPPRWPCDGYVTTGGVCASVNTQLGPGSTNDMGTGTGTGGVHFRGFMYVMQNFSVPVFPTGTGNPSWLFDGAMRVDGTMTVPGNGTGGFSFGILYDDQINHSILTSNFELQVDSMTAIP